MIASSAEITAPALKSGQTGERADQVHRIVRFAALIGKSASFADGPLDRRLCHSLAKVGP
jgi:hypothetical protein